MSTEADPSADLRDRIVAALVEEHYRRARAQIVASPEEHQAGFADAVMAVLEGAALDRMTDRLMEETKIRSLEFRNGFDMDIEPARELAAIWVAAARSMLGDAENYTETKVEFDVGLAVDRENPRPKETYTLVVQRTGKLTPHEARQRAEAERNQLKAAIARVRALHSKCEGHTHDCDDCLGRNDVCEWCGSQYPCATIRALEPTQPEARNT